MIKLLKKLQRDERGVSAVEYAILAAVVVVAVATGVSTFGGNITNLFSKSNTALQEAAGTTTPPATEN